MTETKFKTTRSEASSGFCDIEKVNITVFRLFYKIENSKEQVFEQVFYTQSCYSYMRMFTLLELKKYLKSQQNLQIWR